MNIYLIDSIGILSGPFALPETPGIGVQMPANAIKLDKPLPKPDANHAWVSVNGQPHQLSDFRGIVYHTATGEPTQRNELGELPAHLTTKPRPSADHSWNGHSWVLDLVLVERNRADRIDELCAQVDNEADIARSLVVVDPLRAIEYDRARIEAEVFAEGAYQGSVPPMVAAWAINGRSAQEAADDILREAAQYAAALITLREVRLAAKEQIRALAAVGDFEQAQHVASESIGAIRKAVAGVGNNAI